MKLSRLGLALGLCLAFSAPLFAQDPESAFHRAYFLERERGHLEEALELYQKVAKSQEAEPALQVQARERAAAVREELASVDLAALMPQGALFYAEVAQPSEALLSILGQLGLTRSFEEAARAESFTLRPEMVRTLTGIRGIAAAITRLPENGGRPGGVLVANAGDVEILRGLIEAGILAQGTPAEPIQGWPTWSLDERVHVAVGRRLIVLSDSRAEIQGVVARVLGASGHSLASDPATSAELDMRRGAPFFCYVNAVPLRPMLAGLLAAQRGSPGAAVLAAALDVDSLKALVARLAVGDEGLALETELFLEKGHRNLVFNLLRHAPVDPALLDRIPEGVAAFMTGAFNQRGPAIAALDRNPDGAAVVTFEDFGRELFANLAGFAVFVLPGGAPVPAAALLLSSNDPARTEAVLGLVLGLVNVYSSGDSVDGELHEIAGATTHVYRLPLGLPLYLTRHEDTLILSPSEELIETALESRSNGNSVLHDKAFAAELGRLDKDTTLALCAHFGRCIEVAQPYLQNSQRESLRPFAGVLAQTVAALRLRHSDSQLALVFALDGLPRIDGLVGEALAQQRKRGFVTGVGAPSQPKAQPKAQPEVAQGFEPLAAVPGGEEAARAFAREALARMRGDGRGLNNFAWSLLTEERHAGRFDDLALAYAQAANEATGNSVWQYLDTLALAKFQAGSVREAIELEERALGLVEAAADRREVEASLERFRAAQDSLASEAHPR